MLGGVTMGPALGGTEWQQRSMNSAHSNYGLNPQTTAPQFAEHHYSPAEIAERWALSVDSIRRMFESEPGVLIFENPERASERRRRTLRIPQSVAERVYRRLGSRVAHSNARSAT